MRSILFAAAVLASFAAPAFAQSGAPPTHMPSDAAQFEGLAGPAAGPLSFGDRTSPNLLGHPRPTVNSISGCVFQACN